MRTNMMIAVAIGAVVLIAGAMYVALGVSGSAAQDNSTATVSGFVMDQNKVGVPGATVTIYKCELDNTTITYVNKERLSMPGNPQTTSNGSTAAPGVYTFYKVPFGLYNITAEMGGHLWFAVIEVREPGTQTANIAIPDYAYTPDAGNSTQTQRTTITGMVYDKNHVALPGATVTLYKETRDASALDGWNNTGKLDIKDNPQATNDGSTAAQGSFIFTGVLAGRYNITVEKDGHTSFGSIEASALSVATISFDLVNYTSIPPAVTPVWGSLSPAPA